jgi:hypothetical protein
MSPGRRVHLHPTFTKPFHGLGLLLIVPSVEVQLATKALGGSADLIAIDRTSTPLAGSSNAHDHHTLILDYTLPLYHICTALSSIKIFSEGFALRFIAHRKI